MLTTPLNQIPHRSYHDIADLVGPSHSVEYVSSYTLSPKVAAEITTSNELEQRGIHNSIGNYLPMNHCDERILPSSDMVAIQRKNKMKARERGKIVSKAQLVYRNGKPVSCILL